MRQPSISIDWTTEKRKEAMMQTNEIRKYSSAILLEVILATSGLLGYSTASATTDDPNCTAHCDWALIFPDIDAHTTRLATYWEEPEWDPIHSEPIKGWCWPT